MNLTIEEGFEIQNVVFDNLETLEVLRSDNTMPYGNTSVFADSVWPKSKTYNLSGSYYECGKTLDDFIAYLLEKAGQVVHCLYISNDPTSGDRDEFDCIIMLRDKNEFREVRPGEWDIALELIKIGD